MNLIKYFQSKIKEIRRTMEYLKKEERNLQKLLEEAEGKEWKTK